MIVVIHQPEFLPWLGFFDKIDKADLFVVMDHVQFEPRYFQNRNKIKTAEEWQWLTVPVTQQRFQNINEVRTYDETRWKAKHWNALVVNYSKSKYFAKYADFFQQVYTRDWELLVDLNLYLIQNLMNMLGLNTPIVRSSALDLREGARKTDLLIDICRVVGGDTYLSGVGGKNYMEMEKFEKERIEVIFQEFKHPTYPQLFGEFLPYMSVIDLLFNCGDRSLDIIRGEGYGEKDYCVQS